MNKRLANIVKEDMLKKKTKESWESIRREVAEDVAKNYTAITGVDINDLFTKGPLNLFEDKNRMVIENVIVEVFDKQIPKIYKWIKQNYKLEREDYEDMIHDSDFVDWITDELVYMVDIDKVKYEE